jgi:serine/threonine protein kinase
MSKRFQIGERIGDYQIVGFLGAGGMGSVYHGVHTKINRSAAIKILSNVASSSNFKERFFNEARLQSSLHHPNIATLYDFQESGDLLFIVMEYVDGETLDALIGRRYFAVEDAVITFESICDAVAFIHSNNIVHRDIKPQNIKLASNGMVKLLDFGIAKGEISHGLTRVGGVIGTPNYLAPEQLSGQPATSQSDIWALGILFYEMLTGTEPFKGTTLSELYLQITTSKFEPPEILNSVVPADVSRIVSKCLQHETGQRYQSVTEILSDVQAAKRRYQGGPAAKSKKAFAFPRNALLQLAKKDTHSEADPDISGHGQPAKENRNLISTGIAVSAAALLILLLLVGIGLWAMSGSGNTNSNTGNSRVVAGTEPSISSRSPSPTNNKIPEQQSVSTTQVNDRPRVKVEVIEGAAEVFRDGQLIGTTPLEIQGKENESVDLILKRDGYLDTPVKIDITTRRKVFTFSLKRK